jgi:hypothetical protein
MENLLHFLLQKSEDILAKLGIIAITFFTPFVPFMLSVGVIIICDTIAGRWAAKKLAVREGQHPREVVTSRKTREGLTNKFINYTVAILAIYTLDYNMLNEVVMSYLPWSFSVTRVGVLVIAMIEFDSIDEKYFRVYGITLRDKIKKQITSIKDFIFNLFQFKKSL